MKGCGCQQHELYRAERTLPRGVEFSSTFDCQRFVDRLREHPWWRLEYGPVLRVEVGAARKNGRGSVGGWFPENRSGRIEMHPSHFCVLFVLHELSHVLAEARYGSKSHDPHFARVYMELVYRVMGSEQYKLLLTAFEETGVVHDPRVPDRLGVRYAGPATC